MNVCIRRLFIDAGFNVGSIFDSEISKYLGGGEILGLRVINPS